MDRERTFKDHFPSRRDPMSRCRTVLDPGLIRSGTNTFRRTNLAFFAAGFVTFITLYDVQPLLPVFSREFNLPPALGSLPLSVATAALALTMLFSGTISETWGRKRIMVLSLFCTSVLALLTAFSNGFAELLAIRLLQGMVLAGLPSVAMTYLSEEIEPRSISSAMGLYISGTAIGGMSGRIFSAAMAEATSWRLAFAVIGVACLALSGYFAQALPAASHSPRRPFGVGYLFTSLYRALQEPGLRCLYGLAFLGMGGFVTLYNYITFRLLAAPYLLSQTAVSLIFLVYLLGSLSSSVMGRLAGRLGRSATVRAGLALMAGGLLLTLAAPVPVVVAGVGIFTIGFFGVHTVASSWVGRRVPASRAQASSLYLFFYYLGSSIFGTAGGYFWTAAGWPGVAGLVGGLLLGSFVLVGRLTALPERE